MTKSVLKYLDLYIGNEIYITVKVKLYAGVRGPQICTVYSKKTNEEILTIRNTELTPSKSFIMYLSTIFGREWYLCETDFLYWFTKTFETKKFKNNYEFINHINNLNSGF